MRLPRRRRMTLPRLPSRCPRRLRRRSRSPRRSTSPRRPCRRPNRSPLTTPRPRRFPRFPRPTSTSPRWKRRMRRRRRLWNRRSSRWRKRRLRRRRPRTSPPRRTTRPPSRGPSRPRDASRGGRRGTCSTKQQTRSRMPPSTRRRTGRRSRSKRSGSERSGSERSRSERSRSEWSRSRRRPAGSPAARGPRRSRRPPTPTRRWRLTTRRRRLTWRPRRFRRRVDQPGGARATSTSRWTRRRRRCRQSPPEGGSPGGRRARRPSRGTWTRRCASTRTDECVHFFINRRTRVWRCDDSRRESGNRLRSRRDTPEDLICDDWLSGAPLLSGLRLLPVHLHLPHALARPVQRHRLPSHAPLTLIVAPPLKVKSHEEVSALGLDLDISPGVTQPRVRFDPSPQRVPHVLLPHGAVRARRPADIVVVHQHRRASVGVAFVPALNKDLHDAGRLAQRRDHALRYRLGSTPRHEGGG
mmetsp:Transcript_6686/g.26016  ORF Transcript_6686/g.26016 Transcript_6686/m.26016 type:complete len:469 (-) Transcript_6686:116-1522(-)